MGSDAIAALQMNTEGKSLQCLALASSTPTLPAELRSEYEHLFDKQLGLAKGFKHKVKGRRGS